MHYPNLPALLSDRRVVLAKGPIALVLIEDDIEIESTLAHLQKCGFAQVIAFCAAEIALPEQTTRVDYDISSSTALPDIVNAVIEAAPDVWLHYCYNAEYLFYPFCEDRRIGELLTFNTEERRNTVLTYVVDLYAADLEVAPSGVDRQNAYLDKSGYYAIARHDHSGEPLERQMDFFGGLRWRFEEHVPVDRRRIDRVSLFRSIEGLEMDADRRFNLAEYNTFSCPWHHSLTAATCSFRTAKALRRNPGSRDKIGSLYWQNSVPFNWQSQQLFDLGLMEPGQWF